MKSFIKVLLVAGIVSSLFSGIISIVAGKVDVYAFISASLFFNCYLYKKVIDRYESRN